MSNFYLRNLSVPFFSQRKNTYIWKSFYTATEAKDLGKTEGDLKEQYSMGCNSCNITSIAMVLHYYGITEETPDMLLAKFYATYPTFNQVAVESWVKLKKY